MKKTGFDILFLVSLCTVIIGFGAAIFIFPQKNG